MVFRAYGFLCLLILAFFVFIDFFKEGKWQMDLAEHEDPREVRVQKAVRSRNTFYASTVLFPKFVVSKFRTELAWTKRKVHQSGFIAVSF